jgi:NAD(P)-dependent dehydrogenase (short-subunit alcohol dehydrogenase family)
VPFKLIRALTPIYVKEGIIKNAFRNRSIINISSASSYPEIMRKSDKYLSVYSIAKTALNMLTEIAAKECIEFGVRVNSIAPSNFSKNDAKKIKISKAIISIAMSRSNGVIVHYKDGVIN